MYYVNVFWDLARDFVDVSTPENVVQTLIATVIIGAVGVVFSAISRLLPFV